MRGGGTALLCFLALYSAADVMKFGLHVVARAVLCLGLVALFMRALRDRPAAVLQLARRGAIGGGIAVMLCVALLPVARSVQYRNSFNAAAAARPGAPNVILIVWDTVRAASMSLYGYARPTTPNLDRLAQRAIVFERAISAAPWTLPSHASMFTGLYHHEHSADRKSPLEASAMTLAEYLKNTGYQTAGFIGNTYWAGSGFGLAQGFGWYEDRPTKSARSVLLTWRGSQLLFDRIIWSPTPNQRINRIPAERSHASLLRWLDDRDKQRPFFVFLNEFDAHEPYLPPSGAFPFSSNTPLHVWDDQTDKHRWSPAQLRELNDAYDACIVYLDQELEKLHSALERLGLLENTVVVLTADHGETLGEQDERLLGHIQNAYYNVLNVPLVLYWPSRITQGRVVDQVVSLVDLPATLVDVVNDGAAQQRPFPGTSLWPLVRSQPVAARPALSQVNPASYHRNSKVWPTAGGSLYSLVGTEGYHYIASAGGREQLFDVKADPWERNDLTATPAGKTVVARYRKEMAKLIPDGLAPVSQ
jgi:arylsulfatase A-like enzyme